MRRALAMVVFALSIHGCALGLDAFCAQYADAFCEASKACCTDPKFKREGCRNYHLGLCELTLARAVAGHRAFDKASAEACLREVREQTKSCPGRSGTAPFPLERYDSCKAVTVGSATEGQACSGADPDCAPAFTCLRVNEADVCRPTPCGGACPSGSYCASGPEPRQCQPLPARGESCAQAQRCGSEEDYCTAGSCRAKLALGEPCSSGISCLSRLCVDSKCAESPDPYCEVRVE